MLEVGEGIRVQPNHYTTRVEKTLGGLGSSPSGSLT